jgi:DNA-binding IclR family transcriptional regulator
VERDLVTTGNLDRGLAILELLVANAPGMRLHEIADRLNIPRSATHRLLTELVRHGYVRQDTDYADYMLTLKLCSLGLAELSRSGVVDIAQPYLDNLAEESGEVARLSVIDGDQLIWVAKAQGAPAGLRFDPDMGGIAELSCTASGHAWLSCLSDEVAVELITKQGGFTRRREEPYGPNAAKTIQELLQQLHEARARGFSIVAEAVHVGIAAVAAPVHHAGTGQPIAAISVAGPHVRLTDARLEALGPKIVAAAAALSAASAGSPMLRKAFAGSSNSREPSPIVAKARGRLRA